MSTTRVAADPGLPPLAALPALLAAAPHRLLFFGGACATLLSMLWWLLALAQMRFGWPAMPAAPIPAGWAHAISMQYHVLSLFIFGFLLTVFPRWMALPPYTRRHYVPVAGAIFGGYVLTLAGLLGAPWLLRAGAVLTLAGWATGLALLLRCLWLDAARTAHAVSCWCALALGGFGFTLYALYLVGGDSRLLFGAIKIGTFGLLLPMYATVCHRMMPFFAQNVVPGYVVRRPMAWLAAFWVLALLHLALELAHGYAWLWPGDLAMAVLTAWMWWRWQPWSTRNVRLLAVLFVSFAWLPLAFVLFAAQSAWFAWTGAFVLGRGPVHALVVGYFGGMLVAMVTRVTQGHSGRPLEMGATAWFAFVAVQAVAVLRVAAEALPDAPAWQVAAALGWLLAFAPWVARSVWIYATPRADGKPG